MMDPPEDPTDPTDPLLDVVDRQMLVEIKANVLGTSPETLHIGRFRVLDCLGEGSMGIVFAAFDERLNRRVAIKLLHQGAVASEEERRARILREAQSLAKLTHPNIVHVHEVGEHEGQTFMAMELVEGKPLNEIQCEQPSRGWRALLGLYLEAGQGLAAAHAKGVVHRDFKPHNVLVDNEGRVRVVDFGLALGTLGPDQQLTTEIPLFEDGAIERSRGGRLTATGAVAGTPAYMAPELFEGQQATAASDQFAFCVALYEALYDRRPFEGAHLHDVISAAKQGRILPPPEGRSVPRWLFEVIARGLASLPDARYAEMELLLAELGRDRTHRWKQGRSSSVADNRGNRSMVGPWLSPAAA